MYFQFESLFFYKIIENTPMYKQIAYLDIKIKLIHWYCNMITLYGNSMKIIGKSIFLI